MRAGVQLRRAAGAVATFGRLTREDAVGLGAVFMQVARRQASDARQARVDRVRTALAGRRDSARKVLAQRPQGVRRALDRARAGIAKRGR